MQQLFDRFRRGLGRVLRLAVFPDVSDVQEGGALQPNLDERALHAGQHAGNAAEVDITHQTAMAGPLDVQLINHTVVEHRHPRLLRCDVDEDLFSHWLTSHSNFCCVRHPLQGDDETTRNSFAAMTGNTRGELQNVDAEARE